ncbi:MAG: CHASE2 domain-containing protein [Myxococcota bacterium]
MDSDDQVVDDLEAQFNATPPPAPPPPPEVQDTAKPKRWFERWLIGPDQPKAGQTFTRLSRHLSYEVVVTTVTFLMASILLFTSFNGEMRDLYIKARELIGAYPAVTSDEVVLVTVGTEALYLWNPEDPAPEVTPRALLGEVVSILDSAGANVIVLDFLLHAPAPGDERLAQASTAHGAVIAADRFVVTEAAVGAHFAPGPAASLGEAMASGFANLGEEALWTSSDERLVRGTQLVQSVDRARLSAPWPASVGQAQGASQITPHMALLAAWMHTHPGRASTDTLLARLADGCTPRPLSCKTSLADLGLPGGPALEGAFPINFRGPESADGLATVQAAQLLRLAAEPALYRMAGVETPAKIPTWLSNEVKGKIVVVGRVDGQADDRFATPYGFPLPTRTDMDGARIQAHAIDTLLSGRHVQSAPRWTMWTLAGVVLLGLVLTSTRLREDLHTALALASGLVLVLIGAIIFTLTDGLVLDLSVPLTSLILGIVAIRLRGWAID